MRNPEACGGCVKKLAAAVTDGIRCHRQCTSPVSGDETRTSLSDSLERPPMAMSRHGTSGPASSVMLMMRQGARRMTATMLVVLLGQFSATGNGYACTMHATQDVSSVAHPATNQMSGHEHQTSHPRPAHDPTPLDRCDVPCAPAACGSAVTCSVTAAAVLVSDFSPAALGSAAAIAPDVLRPRSLTTAPEPPPPRA